MTEQEKQLGRRNFIKAVATLPAAGALLWKSSSIQPVRAGIIGPGGQGRVLMENSNPNFLKLVAVCDIYPPNLEKGLAIARKNHDPNAQGYADYRPLLERKDIDAVVIAVPLWAHAPLAVEALQAGKHVFCEKTMAFTVEDCKKMIQAARTAGTQSPDRPSARLQPAVPRGVPAHQRRSHRRYLSRSSPAGTATEIGGAKLRTRNSIRLLGVTQVSIISPTGDFTRSTHTA